MPFESEDNFKLFELIKAGKCDLSDKNWDYVSPQVIDLVKRLLVSNPEKRISRDELRDHPWLSGKFKASDEILPFGAENSI
jgi:serine/threonine protein kinase